MKRTTVRARPEQKKKLSEQVVEKLQNDEKREPKESRGFDGSEQIISTGSTLLDLAISGGRFSEGGVPTGILVEVFGPSGAGKTVLLCQIASNVQKAGGPIMFHDPEARLNKQFARMFGLDTDTIDYTTPNTIPEVFDTVRKWKPDKKNDVVCGVFADSLAALSTDLEMGESGDKMGMRRAKEFSEELRKTCRIITEQNMLIVCSNQVRQNNDAGMWGPKYKSPGGEAIGFYSSLRLRCSSAQKIKMKRSISGVEHSRVIGVQTDIEVFKSSIWKPFRTASLYILFDYGIDDIRGNLEFLKKNTGSKTYIVGGNDLGKALPSAIKAVEEGSLEKLLKRDVIALWHEIEEQFTDERKPRRE